MSAAFRSMRNRLGISALGLALSCSSETLILGEALPPIRVGDGVRTVEQAAGQPLPGINTVASEQNPSLTGDGRELYFTSNREGGPGRGDVWRATRPGAGEAFGPAEPVAEASTEYVETSVAVSPDGLWLWVGSNRPGALGGEEDIDIWQFRRSDAQGSWQLDRQVTELNSTFDDIPRPPGGPRQTMPMATKRDTADRYQTYLTDHSDGGFSSPVVAPGLDQTQAAVVDGFLSSSGKYLLYNRQPPNGDADLYVAWRSRAEGAFEGSMPLDAINTDADERDPALNADDSLLFFTTSRDGQDDIYVVAIDLPPL